MSSFFTSLLAWHYCWQKQHMLQAGHSFVGCPKVIAKCHMSLVPSKLAHHMRGPRGPFLMAGKLGCRGRNCHDCADLAGTNVYKQDLNMLRSCRIDRIWRNCVLAWSMEARGVQRCSHSKVVIGTWLKRTIAPWPTNHKWHPGGWNPKRAKHPALLMSTFTYGRHLSLQRAAKGRWEFIQSEVRNFRPFETCQKAKQSCANKKAQENFVHWLVWCMHMHRIPQNLSICAMTICLYRLYRVYTFQVSVLFLSLSVSRRGLCQWKTLSLLDLGCCLRCT